MNGRTGLGHADGLHAASWFNLGLGFVFAISFVGFAWRAHYQVPYADDWNWLQTLQDPQPYSRSLWRLHNEHITVVPRLLVWVDYWLWTWPAYLTSAVALVCHALVATVLVRASFHLHHADVARLLSGTVLALTFLTYQLQSVVFASAVSFPLTAGFGVLSIWLVAHASEASTFARSLVRVAAAAACCTVALLSLTGALALPIILAALATRVSVRLRWRTVAAFLLVAAAVIAWRALAGGSGPVAVSTLSLQEITFALAFLGGPLASLSAPAAVGAGACVLAASVWVLYSLIRRGNLSPSELALVGCLVLVLANAAMVGLGRGRFGLANAAQSRYVMLVSVGWCALLILAVPRGKPSIALRRLALALPVGSLLALPLQALVGFTWIASADHLWTASLALKSGVHDSAWLWRLHPAGWPAIAPIVPMFKDRHAAFLAWPERGAVTPHARTDAPACAGTVLALDPNLSGELSDGFRIEASLQGDGAALIILDQDSRVRGLAEPAPVLSYARGSKMAFAVAALRDLFDRQAAAGGKWVGFAARGQGTVYTAELRDTAGHLVCRAPVACCAAPHRAPDHASPAATMPITGHLDEATCARVRGWAWNPLRANAPVSVTLTLEGVVGAQQHTWTVTADRFRADLSASGIGDGRHGFVWGDEGEPGIPAGDWRLSAAEAESGIMLKGSPQHVTCR